MLEEVQCLQARIVQERFFAIYSLHLCFQQAKNPASCILNFIYGMQATRKQIIQFPTSSANMAILKTSN